MGRTRDQARRDKYRKYTHPFFQYCNSNPFHQITTDCVIRAITTACEMNYCDVVMDFAKIQCETGKDPSYKETWSKYIEEKGWQKQREPRHENNTRYTIDEYIAHVNPKLTCIAKLGTNHIAAVVDGVVMDTWDSSHEVLHTFWVLEG